ncbi:MAG: DNA gyrase inhibitor YacG [Planctomycetota bacterium]|nr:DNA gyrase inhibitor YacG [Planctomycetota bacterium]
MVSYANNPPTLSRFRCPRCGKAFECSGPASHKAFPFCSRRCQMVDLGNWLGERYVIPGDKNIPGAPISGEHEDRR